MAGSDYLVKYCDSNSILIINDRGMMRQLFTPFEVQCALEVGRFKMGSIAQVEEVAEGGKDKIIYFIGEGVYFHKHFRILADF